MVGIHSIKNGELIKVEEATVNVTNREVQFSFSVYESIRIIEHRPVFVEDHISRLFASAKGIGLSFPFSRKEIISWINKLILADDIEKASMRILVVGGKRPSVFITASTILSYSDELYKKGVVAFTYNGERLFPQYKTSNLLMSYVALQSAREKNGFEAILVDRNGLLLEGTRSNFYAFRGNSLYTAKDSCVLEGVTRTRVIKAAKDLGFEVVLQAPSIEDLRMGRYEEAFISSTSMATMPLLSLDEIEFNKDFSRTMKLNEIIRKLEKLD